MGGFLQKNSIRATVWMNGLWEAATQGAAIDKIIWETTTTISMVDGNECWELASRLCSCDVCKIVISDAAEKMHRQFDEMLRAPGADVYASVYPNRISHSHLY